MEVRVGNLTLHVPIFGLLVQPNNFLVCWLISLQICQVSENKPLEQRDLNSRSKSFEVVEVPKTFILSEIEVFKKKKKAAHNLTLLHTSPVECADNFPSVGCLLCVTPDSLEPQTSEKKCTVPVYATV